MTKIIISGILGHMGKNVLELAKADTDFSIIAGVDLKDCEIDGVNVYSSFEKITEKADAVIDFSSASNLQNVLSYCKKFGSAAILCATGYSDDDLIEIQNASKEIAVFKTGNLSIGINLLQKLVKQAALFLGENFDVEIIEKHHNLKKDAPSGTAYMLAESVNEGFFLVTAQTFHRDDVLSFCSFCCKHTGLYCISVNHNCAGTARAFRASVLN